MKVVWTATALARLVELHDYIAQQSSFSATAVVERLTARAALLATPPLTGRRVPEYRQDDIHEVLVRPYRLVYRVTRERIEILTVKHYRQRLSERPGEL